MNKINRIALTLIMVMFLSFSTTPTSATKIQKNDTWTYEDKDKVQYTETTLDIIQLTAEGNPVAVGIIETTRPFVFGMNLNITGDPYVGDLYIDLTMSYKYMYVTQEGVIPFTASDTIINGIIYESRYNYTIIINNANAVWTYTGDPSESLTTTSSSEYSLQLEYIQLDPYVRYKVKQSFIISSDSNIEDSIKNFTITPTQKYYYYERNLDAVEHVEYTDTGNLELNSFEVAILLTYEEGINQPTYIAQTEPVKTSSSLSLSQASRFVEYFLVRDDVSEPGFLPFYPAVFFLVLPIMVKYRR